jgi:Na+/H+-translocating membrane pyrophosphatase
MEGTSDPDYAQCVAISTKAAIREMVPPGILIMGAPLVTGFLFGIQATAGLLAGSLVAGGVLAISASNAGGAWDNAKKYIEAGNLGGKGTDVHKAAVVGDIARLRTVLRTVRRHPAEVHVGATTVENNKPGHVPGFFLPNAWVS